MNSLYLKRWQHKRVGGNLNQRYYTIGMAGHIDHGKSALTKALTSKEMDRLKEEKERKITIELGYASFQLGEFQTSIIDVPGHEKFIRQMIAGVAGIDLVLLVIAGDEGVMPQTREHMEILSFLGIQHSLIVVTKRDRIEDDFIELIMDDIESEVKDTAFEQAEILFVDSLSGKGIDKLKAAIENKLTEIEQRNDKGVFRMPIDQVFTLQGHGTVVRGTIYEGGINVGDTLHLLPQSHPVKAKQLQVHNVEMEAAIAGQRVAINLSGVGKAEVKRGDSLVSSINFPMTRMIDISLQTVKQLRLPIKQRAPIKFYVGTSEVMGKIIFFDRNELKQQEQVLCQIRLDKPIAVIRGDRYVIRRPSPVETIGGGWIIDPLGAKYRFGERTISNLERKMESTPEERLLDALHVQSMMTKEQLIQRTSIQKEPLETLLISLSEAGKILEIESNVYTLTTKYNEISRALRGQLQQYHEANPLRMGLNKAECIQALQHNVPKKLVEAVLELEIELGHVSKHKHYMTLSDFVPHPPEKWKTNIETALKQLESDELNVEPWNDYLINTKVPASLHHDVKHYVLEQKVAYSLDDQHLIHEHVYHSQIQKLYLATEGKDFTVQEAKTVLMISRKYLLLFLEMLDQQHVTQRDQDQRKWLVKP